MSKKEGLTAIGEATTTLPDGATVSVARIGGKRAYTEIRAWREGNVVKMRGDDIPPQNLNAYLALTVNAINRERARLTVKPPDPITKQPRDIKGFVQHMCSLDMFIFQTLVDVAAETNEAIKTISELEPVREKKRKPARKKDPDKEPF